jgi:hypothetical protein
LFLDRICIRLIAFEGDQVANRLALLQNYLYQLLT